MSLKEEILDKVVSLWGYGRDDEVIDLREYTNDILKIFEKRIDELRHIDELEYQDEEVDYGITLFHDMIKKELLK